jgi:hypothetical protein
MVTNEMLIQDATKEVMRFFYNHQNNAQLNLQAVRIALDTAVYNYVGNNGHDTLIDVSDPLSQMLIRTVIKYL